MSDPLERHRFVCRGCRVRYTHIGQCENCGSEIVVEAEWPVEPDANAMAAPRPHPHVVSASVAALCVPVSVGLAWGEPTMWGVVPCGIVTVALLVARVSPWTKKDVGEEMGAFTRQVDVGSHPLQEGAAREMAAVTSSARPIGCAGLFFGVVAPLVVVNLDEPVTVAAGVLAVLGFVLAWVRRVRRTGEAAAGRGVPL
jgi:hypothetical protein